MMSQQPTKDEDSDRILPFRSRGSRSWNEKVRLPDRWCSPVRDLSKYSRGPEEDDYPHQMFMNLLAFLVLSVIVGCGIWLADSMSERKKDQDCGQISRIYCVPIPGPSETR
jgi:hypothetical protein